jgi:hypothetical protein
MFIRRGAARRFAGLRGASRRFAARLGIARIGPPLAGSCVRRSAPGLPSRGETMPYCTIVEFEWDETFDHERFANVVAKASEAAPPPRGRMSHITGIDATGARMIEVWGSGDDARAHAEQSSPFLAGAELPAPSRVFGFEVTSYVVS